MTECPICQTETKKEYCPTCAWEFEYYFDELEPESKAIYEERFKIWSGIYSRLSNFENSDFMIECNEYEYTKFIPNEDLDFSEIIEWANTYCIQEDVLPREINELKRLVSLDLFGNKLQELPNSIGNLVNLTKFNIGLNELKKLPNSIGNLRKLTSLNIKDNPIKELPTSINNLKKLDEKSKKELKKFSIPPNTEIETVLRKPWYR